MTFGALIQRNLRYSLRRPGYAAKRRFPSARGGINPPRFARLESARNPRGPPDLGSARSRTEPGAGGVATLKRRDGHMCARKGATNSHGDWRAPGEGLRGTGSRERRILSRLISTGAFRKCGQKRAKGRVWRRLHWYCTPGGVIQALSEIFLRQR